jgi:hypothetical protein
MCLAASTKYLNFTARAFSALEQSFEQKGMTLIASNLFHDSDSAQREIPAQPLFRTSRNRVGPFVLTLASMPVQSCKSAPIRARRVFPYPTSRKAHRAIKRKI